MAQKAALPIWRREQVVSRLQMGCVCVCCSESRREPLLINAGEYESQRWEEIHGISPDFPIGSMLPLPG